MNSPLSNLKLNSMFYGLRHSFNGLFKIVNDYVILLPIPVGLRPLAFRDYGFEFRLVHGCLSILCIVCCVRQRTLRRVDHSLRGVLLSVICLSGCDLEPQQ
jgi:hypothetical protein